MLSVLPHRELTLRSPLFPYNLNQVVPCDPAVSIWRPVLLDAPSLSAGDLLRRSAEQASALHQISLQDIRRRSGWLNDSPLSFNWLFSIPIRLLFASNIRRNGVFQASPCLRPCHLMVCLAMKWQHFFSKYLTGRKGTHNLV